MTPEQEYDAWLADRTAKLAALTTPTTVTIARAAAIQWAAGNDTTAQIKGRNLSTVRRGLRIEWTRPDPTKVLGRSRGTVLWVHGAAQTGSAASYRPIAAALALAGPTAVAMLEFRRPPEHHFPAPVEDVVDALAWLEANGRPMSKVVLAGDSFGAMPALAALLRRRTANLPMPAGLYLLCPDADYSNRGFLANRTPDRNPRTCLVTDALNQYFDNPSYPYDGEDASPGLAESLAGLPPILMHESRMAPLAHAIDLRDRLLEEHPATFTFRDWPNVPHIFPTYPGWFTYGARAVAHASAWIRARVS